jgi:hypothetical protein
VSEEGAGDGDVMEGKEVVVGAAEDEDELVEG